MKKAETVTAENFGKYEKKLWRMECRCAKARAAGVAGRIAGDIVFVLGILGCVYWAAGAADDAEIFAFPVFKTLGLFWEAVCDTFVQFFEVFKKIDLEFLSMLVAILAAFTANIFVNVLTRLFWPRARFAPMDSSRSAVERADELSKRASDVNGELPSRKWYFNLIPITVFTVIMGVESYYEILAEGKDVFSGMLEAIGISFMLAALPYFLYRGLSGLAVILINAFSPDLNGHHDMRKALKDYAKECREQAEKEEKRERARKKLEEKRQKEEQERQNRLRGDEIYRKATAGGEVDEEMVAEAAELGCRPACLYMGRKLMDAWIEVEYDDIYTKDEKKELIQAGKEYFYTASQEDNFRKSQIEGEFGYHLFSVLLLEADGSLQDVSVSRWRELLSRLEDIRKSGQLPEKYNKTSIQLINYVSDMLDTAEAKERFVKEFSSAFTSLVNSAHGGYTTYSASSPSSPYPPMGSEGWHKMHDDLDAVQDALGGSGWADGV